MLSLSLRPLAALIAMVLLATLAACAGGPQRGPTATVTGAVTYDGRQALPRPGTVIVTLQEVSRADAPATIVARQEIVLTGASAPPFPFTLVYEPGRIDPRGRYVLRAEARDAGGELRFTTTDAYPVITQGAPRVLDVALRALNEPAPAPAAAATAIARCASAASPSAPWATNRAGCSIFTPTASNSPTTTATRRSPRRCPRRPRKQRASPAMMSSPKAARSRSSSAARRART